jgi:hypothetical protein
MHLNELSESFKTPSDFKDWDSETVQSSVTVCGLYVFLARIDVHFSRKHDNLNIPSSFSPWRRQRKSTILALSKNDQLVQTLAIAS